MATKKTHPNIIVDKLDIKILRELDINPRASLRRIAKTAHSSEPVIFYRIERMKKGIFS